jgi:hypothetical protein
MTTLNQDALEFRTLTGDALSDEDRSRVFDLFDACYRDANHVYLERTLERLRYVTLASDGERLVGFGTGEQRVADLPGLPKTNMTLGGLSCVATEYRRQGLVLEMGRRNMERGNASHGERRLVCARNAHPAAFAMFRFNATVVPRTDAVPTPWQREVGQAVADIYGAEHFDPDTFVCVGSGDPIGYPILEMNTTPEEWEVFEPVDRDRGDTLLGIVWLPDAPAGW